MACDALFTLPFMRAPERWGRWGWRGGVPSPGALRPHLYPTGWDREAARWGGRGPARRAAGARVKLRWQNRGSGDQGGWSATLFAVPRPP